MSKNLEGNKIDYPWAELPMEVEIAKKEVYLLTWWTSEKATGSSFLGGLVGRSRGLPSTHRALALHGSAVVGTPVNPGSGR